jgi:hypothetical protein
MPARLLTNVYVVRTNERAALAFLTDAVGGADVAVLQASMQIRANQLPT